MLKMPHIGGFGWLLALWFVSATLSAQVVPDIDGSRDLDSIERFPGSGIVRFTASESVSRYFATGKVKKVQGMWRPEKERQVRGRLTSITYRIEQRYSSRQVYEFFTQQLETLNFRTLFACADFACGPSNKWANTVFAEKVLYGPDKNQFYLLAETAEALLGLYVIKRGNKRVYARLDWVDVSSSGSGGVGSAESADSWSEALRLTGRLELAVDQLNWEQPQTSEQLAELAAWLKSQSVAVRVVGHKYGSADLPTLLQESEQLAQDFANRMLALQVGSKRISVHGLGPLAPAHAAPSDRVVLLLVE